jgi:hypothetical protein
MQRKVVKKKNFLTLEDGASRLSRNFGTELPLCAAYNIEERKSALYTFFAVFSAAIAAHVAAADATNESRVCCFFYATQISLLW